MKIDESMKKEIKEEMEKIQVPSSMYEFAKNIKEESEKRADFEKATGRKRGWRKSQFVVAAVISLVVLTGSAFLNPTMAEMASKIPYIGQIFHKPIHEVITEALVKEGYQPTSIGMGIWRQKPHFDISLEGTEEYVKQEEDKVLTILTEILEKKGYDNYELTVSDTNEVSPALKEIGNQREELGEKLMSDLQGAGYSIMNVNAYGPVVNVYIPIADEAKKVEIYKAAIELLKANDTPSQVQIITRDVSEEELKDKWMPVMRSIEEEFFLKKEYRVADISYSYKPEKVSITIMTNMKLSEVDTKETVTKIRKEITEFLHSEEVKTMTENQKYELIVQDKNGKDFPF
ncbi:DUF4030 domain-containing protein [Psychrobacillus sp. FJAT-21963]|uniref:DUF4030 domain-containing protein n=1 Tax=Psychrobacillus sp. FJAT-21963 TaxID=1712028 RepID=UPI0006F4F399|nr:DUF4030 domain-containing protein [Psychrobacillus sp. FJAT-21963]KQL33710.1 hypothetical protein AN959_16430 [Psychrobacillus sp. FJAT-21963]